MSPPVVRVNTFVEEKVESKLDRISKIYIIIELICGIHRLTVFGKIKPFFLVISLAFSLSMNCVFIYVTFAKGILKMFDKLILTLKVFQYCMCAILGFALRKKLSDFFSELSKFDRETGFRRVNKEMIKNILQFILSVGFICLFIILLHIFDISRHFYKDVLVIQFIHITELHFFGHLLSLLISRLQFINHLMKCYFANRCRVTTIENQMCKCVNDRNHQATDMKKLMEFYHKIIVAFDTLNEAIKWQMLIILITSFLTSLAVSYKLTLQYIRGDYFVIKLLANVILTTFEMIPMFGPCRIVDAVHSEVQCLIEMLSSKLYENKIEKSSRPVAQAMLALMEARDLSFSLLRIFDIDISFPFKFLGLLVTYLIIMMQFEKVINLERSNI